MASTLGRSTVETGCTTSIVALIVVILVILATRGIPASLVTRRSPLALLTSPFQNACSCGALHLASAAKKKGTA